MKQVVPTMSRRKSLSTARFTRSTLVALLSCAGLWACGGGGNDSVNFAAGEVGSVVDQPDPGIGSLRFVVDANKAGNATLMRINSVKWGRLVNVLDSNSVVQHTDYVIGEDIDTTPGTPDYPLGEFRLETNAITEQTSVTIGAPYSPSLIVNGQETSLYQKAFKKLDKNLVRLSDLSLDEDEIGPFPIVPRNAAIVVVFDDLIDPTTISAETIRTVVGYPPSQPFSPRVIPDVNHGDLADFDGDGHPTFFTTRVILDTTVSQLDAVNSNPPLSPNPIGLPASVTLARANAAIRIPTRVDTVSGQLRILRNLSGHGVSFNGNGSVDPDTLGTTRDVVRAMRSGGSTNITQDPNNGFLSDKIPPRLLGTQAVGVLAAPIAQPGGTFLVPLQFTFLQCASALKVGDIIQQPGVVAEVTEISDPPVSGVVNAVFRIAFPPSGQITLGQAELSTAFDSVLNFGKEACFVRFSHLGQAPDKLVATDTTVTVRFSEPIDPAKVTPFDNMTMSRSATNPQADQFVIGEVIPSPDLREFTFAPLLPLRHNANATEDYYFKVIAGATGITDLAGNSLATSLPQVKFTLNPQDVTQNTGGIALRFNSPDELFNDGNSEMRGQFLFNTERGVLTPRSVIRTSFNCDITQPVPSFSMSPFPSGLQTPLSRLGSRMQSLWRYCDFGLGLLDEAFTNVDVEGINWAPVGGSALQDTFERFEITLSHSKWLPDESTDPANNLIYPDSGLVKTYASNYLDPVNDPPKIVHPRARGYNVAPSEVFVTDTGVRVIPFPLNRGLAPEDRVYYTWRDTSILSVGGANSSGAELKINAAANNLPAFGKPWGPGQVPTIGLPILMDFKCFPDNEALGLNSFDVLLAATTSSKPNFRAFSTGGTSTSGDVIKDPDLEQEADGGFNPASVPQGAITLGVDNTVYIGQLDVVIRVSRAHTIWLDSLGTGGAGIVTYVDPVLEPRLNDLPAGTSLVLAFRGASAVTGTANAPRNADFYDPYGDPVLDANSTAAFSVTYVNNDRTWKEHLSSLNGSRFFQTRVTFIGSAVNQLVPELSALGFAFRR